MGVGQDPTRADDKLAGKLPRVVDERPIGAMTRSGQVQAGLRFASKEGIGRIEQDLGGGPLEQAEGFVGRALRVGQDGDVKALKIAEAGGSFRLTLSDDDDIGPGIPVGRQLISKATGSIRPARAAEMAPEQQQQWPVPPER